MSIIKPEITAYVDDIPMKISESFKPKNFSTNTMLVPQLPNIENQEFTYNFKKELFALEVAELKKQKDEENMRLKEQMEAELKAKEELNNLNKVQDTTTQIIENGEATSNSSIKCVDATDVDKETNNHEEVNVPLTSLGQTPNYEENSLGILKPKPSERNNQFQSNFIPIKTINPADFESSNSSPFDDALLNAIDDKQELNRVFQQFYSVKSSSERSFQYPQSAVPVSQMNGVSLRGNMSTTVSNSYMYQRFYEQPSNQSQNFYSHQSMDKIATYVPQTSQCTSDANFSTTQSFPLRSSKSTSDLQTVTSSDTNTISSDRSRTPPLNSTTVKTRSPAQCSYLPNPYSELPEQLRTFVNNVCEMGFEKGRVSRAAQHLGNDEKKVFEYLFQIQALEDLGFDCDDSEYAFTKNEFDMEKAKHFLTSMRQLCEVGFKREAVIKALLQAGSDRDKALDHLLSSQ